MADSGGDEPTETVYLYRDPHGVMTIRASDGLRGGGESSADALRTLADEIETNDHGEKRYDWMQ